MDVCAYISWLPELAARLAFNCEIVVGHQRTMIDPEMAAAVEVISWLRHHQHIAATVDLAMIEPVGDADAPPQAKNNLLTGLPRCSELAISTGSKVPVVLWSN